MSSTQTQGFPQSKIVVIRATFAKYFGPFAADKLHRKLASGAVLTDLDRVCIRNALRANDQRSFVFP